MALERSVLKEYVNLEFGLAPFESWEDLVKDKSMMGWGWFLENPRAVIDAHSSSDVTQEERQRRAKAIEDKRLKDRQLLREAESIHIMTGKITPYMPCDVSIYDGREKTQAIEFGALIGATGKPREDVLFLVNYLMLQLNKMDERRLDPIWGREGLFQYCSNFFTKPVVGHFFNSKQEYTPRIRK